MKKSVATLAVSVLSVGALLIAPSSAIGHDNNNSNGNSNNHKDKKATVLFGQTDPVPGLNQGESANFKVIDTGKSLIIIGSAKGMQRDTVYTSLIYPQQDCAGVVGPLGNHTVHGMWQDHGDRKRRIFSRYDGESYDIVKGNVESVSIRSVTTVVEPLPGQTNPVLTASLEARSCANLSNE